LRSFLWFIGLIAAGFVAMAVFTYPAWLAVSPVLDAPFHRVGSRLGMLFLLVGFILMARRLGLADRASLGYALPRPLFLRELGIGFVLGLALMLPIVGLMIALDLRVLKPGLVLDAATLAPLLLKGVLAGFAVAFIEETFLRGAMHTGIARESGPRAAILLTAAVYAAFHFIGRFRIPREEVHAGSGLDLVAGSLRAFAEPALIADAFLCLMAVGVLLGIVRHLTGNIAACIGLHAGWVTVITAVRATSRRDPSNELSWLLSRFDGMVGWLVLAWTVVIGLALIGFYRRRA
jgi:uncharacterized protein